MWRFFVLYSLLDIRYRLKILFYVTEAHMGPSTQWIYDSEIGLLCVCLDVDTYIIFDETRILILK
jgi:hypothetical protein